MGKYNKHKFHKTTIKVVDLEKGESIEEKMRRVTTTNEPIDNVAPMIYTERKDGVLPECDIRTDRWDIAQEAMGAVAKSEAAKRQAAEQQSTEQQSTEQQSTEQQSTK